MQLTLPCRLHIFLNKLLLPLAFCASCRHKVALVAGGTDLRPRVTVRLACENHSGALSACPAGDETVAAVNLAGWLSSRRTAGTWAIESFKVRVCALKDSKPLRCWWPGQDFHAQERWDGRRERVAPSDQVYETPATDRHGSAASTATGSQASSRSR